MPDSCVSGRVELVLKKSHQKILSLKKIRDVFNVCIFLNKNTNIENGSKTQREFGDKPSIWKYLHNQEIRFFGVL